MYDHRKPTMGRDLTIPGSKGPDVKKAVDCKEPVEQKPIEDKKPIKKPIEDKKPPKKEEKPKEEKKFIDPWTYILFGPPRTSRPVQEDDKKDDNRPRGFSWL